MGDVVVLDDFFPDLRTGFRVAEFTAHLRAGTVDRVLTTAGPFHELSAQFGSAFPDLVDRVQPYSRESLDGVGLAYIVFLNNADAYLDDLTSASVPFVVTLYPGGGLNLGTEEGERKLARVLGSPLLRHVITTQPLVTERARAALGAESEVPVTEIPGIVSGGELFVPGAGMRSTYFGSGKEILDVAFVAFKYSERGADKGFPEFAEFVRLAHEAGLPVRAHVVGGFDEHDLDPGYPAGLLTFLPAMRTSELRSFFLGIDLIVSPNRPGLLSEGAFDGFPLGTCVEAALAGVAVMASDELQQNRLYRDGRDILIIQPDPAAMLRRLDEVLREPGGLRRVAHAGLRTTRKHYAPEMQVAPRARIIESAALTSAPDEAQPV